MVSKPERFNDISHLIIDEVHERSVDTDILCLLCRRLMITNKDIRLILMSATLAASLYKEYFGVPEPPIQVGARRFPVEEVFLEDIKRKVTLPMKEIQSVEYLLKQCLNMRCIRTPSMAYMEKLYTVVAKLATIIGEAGTSVLIFVPGMNDSKLWLAVSHFDSTAFLILSRFHSCSDHRKNRLSLRTGHHFHNISDTQRYPI